MNPLSSELVDRLTTLKAAFPSVVDRFHNGEFGPGEQRDLARQLMDLADMLSDHADDQELGIIELSTTRPASRLSRYAKRRVKA
jgi:hypothetical protein